MRFIACPLMATVDAALDWFEERGAERIVLWRGLDGLTRGSGRIGGGS